jgi:pyruvate dehydrogenase E2 component (dihydrolipoamide acetyltransferase)
MATEVKLPRLGQGMESGTVVRWLKEEGESVGEGEPLFELDTDKVTQEVESPSSGVLLRIVLPEGEAAVGTTIAFIGKEGEEVPELAPVKVEEEAGELAPERATIPEPERERGMPAPAPVAEVSAANGRRTKASPLARRLASERGLALESLQGTGPEGRIVAEDVERASRTGRAPTLEPASGRPGPAPGQIERVPLTSVRRTSARRLTEAWQAPAFQITASVDMGEVLRLHERLRQRAPAGEGHISIADFLTKACALALVRYPGVNALWAGDAVELHGSIDIGIATATERGLIVPVIRSCERRTLAELAAARADLVSRTVAGTVSFDELEGGTFTITNLGTFGVEQFVAVLNPPQVAILAVGAISERPLARAGRVESASLLALTLTCDHRAVDGSVAAGFLAAVKGYLEEPGLML